MRAWPRSTVAGGVAMLALLACTATTAAASSTLARQSVAARAGRASRRNPRAPEARVVPVVVIVMENVPFQVIKGNRSAPFINNTMIRGGELDTNYFAVPGSLADYLLMTSGLIHPPAFAFNLFHRLGTRVSWREFMESMPSVCFTGRAYHSVDGTRAALYARSHNPAIHYANITTSSLCGNVVPLDRADFRPDALPEFSYVVPNECNDMHTLPVDHECPMWNGGTNRASTEIAFGDNWLASFVPQVAKFATVILAWDEGDAANEQIATISYGVGVKPGQDATLYNQPSLEAGLYRYFGLGAAPGRGARNAPLPIP